MQKQSLARLEGSPYTKEVLVIYHDEVKYDSYDHYAYADD